MSLINLYIHLIILLINNPHVNTSQGYFDSSCWMAWDFQRKFNTTLQTIGKDELTKVFPGHICFPLYMCSHFCSHTIQKNIPTLEKYKLTWGDGESIL